MLKNLLRTSGVLAVWTIGARRIKARFVFVEKDRKEEKSTEIILMW